MKQFIEKLIGRLEEYHCENEFEINSGFIEVCIDIVNQLAEEYKPKTQADKIRAMNDEELAEFLKQTVWQEGANLFDCAEYTCYFPCAECKAYLKWLQSEAETKGE